MCSIGASCKCDTGFPLASGITGTLGFTGAQCCRAPCPALPIHHVKICIRINENTSVKIQQGCAVANLPQPTCPVDYNWGLIENSWGRSCRLVEWNRKVPSATFIRLRLCGADNCSSCSEIAYTPCGVPIANQLLKFEVDDVDYTSVLQLIANSEFREAGCIHVWCRSDEGPCAAACTAASTGGINLLAMPIGTEIQFGPIGQPVLYNPV